MILGIFNNEQPLYLTLSVSPYVRADNCLLAERLLLLGELWSFVRVVPIKASKSDAVSSRKVKRFVYVGWSRIILFFSLHCNQSIDAFLIAWQLA